MNLDQAVGSDLAGVYRAFIADTADSASRATETPEHLRHHECETAPFTAADLDAIREYEDGSSERAGAVELADLLGQADILAERIGPAYAEAEKDAVLACFDWLSQWYERLDSLKAGLRNGGEGPAHSRSAANYLKWECNRWYRTLHLVRREACKYAFGTAGPQPEVDAGYLTFFDIPGVQLDGTIAAESQ